MPEPPSRRRILRLHVGLAIAAVLCTSAFVVELLRALGGNTLSWAYVFEWPLLLCYGIYMWHRLLRDEHGLPARPLRESTPEETQALEAWNEHLAALHAADAATRVERDGRYAPSAPSAPDRSDAKTAASTPLMKRGDASVE